jgi:hypothetical protein
MPYKKKQVKEPIAVIPANPPAGGGNPPEESDEESIKKAFELAKSALTRSS